MRKRIWLVTTEHLEDRLWFKDEEDFKAAMNFVAVMASLLNVRVVAFMLMSNHVHFVLECSYEDAQEFITRFKKYYSQYFRTKYSKGGLLYRNGVDIREVMIENESFERAVAYVHMNPVAASICLNSTQYPWGTGSLFFNAGTVRGTRVGDYGVRELVRVIRSKVALPPHWLLGEEGYILPSSYVPVKWVESVFRTPKRMNYFLNSSSKARRTNESPGFSDQLMHSAIRDLSISLFHKPGFAELGDQQSAELLRQLRYRFSSDPAQLARVSGLSYARVCELLESFQA
jgi:REP element-mobilizing transposase RayT